MNERDIQFPDWAPKELISTYLNAEEPDPILERLLTTLEMKAAWDKLRAAGMTDLPHAEYCLLSSKNVVRDYAYVRNSPGFRKTPQGLYEYICSILELRKMDSLPARKQNIERLNNLKSAANRLLSLIRESGFDLDNRIVLEYAKVKKADGWRTEAKDSLIAHLEETRKTQIDYPEVSMFDLVQGYIDLLNDPALTKFYHSPLSNPRSNSLTIRQDELTERADTLTTRGDETYFAVLLSNFMRDFYKEPLHQVVATCANVILGLHLEADYVKGLIRKSKIRTGG